MGHREIDAHENIEYIDKEENNSNSEFHQNGFSTRYHHLTTTPKSFHSQASKYSGFRNGHVVIPMEDENIEHIMPGVSSVCEPTAQDAALALGSVPSPSESTRIFGITPDVKGYDDCIDVEDEEEVDSPASQSSDSEDDSRWLREEKVWPYRISATVMPRSSAQKTFKMQEMHSAKPYTASAREPVKENLKNMEFPYRRLVEDDEDYEGDYLQSEFSRNTGAANRTSVDSQIDFSFNSSTSRLNMIHPTSSRAEPGLSHPVRSTHLFQSDFRRQLNGLGPPHGDPVKLGSLQSSAASILPKTITPGNEARLKNMPVGMEVNSRADMAQTARDFLDRGEKPVKEDAVKKKRKKNKKPKSFTSQNGDKTEEQASEHSLSQVPRYPVRDTDTALEYPSNNAVMSTDMRMKQRRNKNNNVKEEYKANTQSNCRGTEPVETLVSFINSPNGSNGHKRKDQSNPLLNGSKKKKNKSKNNGQKDSSHAIVETDHAVAKAPATGNVVVGKGEAEAEGDKASVPEKEVYVEESLPSSMTGSQDNLELKGESGGDSARSSTVAISGVTSSQVLDSLGDALLYPEDDKTMEEKIRNGELILTDYKVLEENEKVEDTSFVTVCNRKGRRKTSAASDSFSGGRSSQSQPQSHRGNSRQTASIPSSHSRPSSQRHRGNVAPSTVAPPSHTSVSKTHTQQASQRPGATVTTSGIQATQKRLECPNTIPRVNSSLPQQAAGASRPSHSTVKEPAGANGGQHRATTQATRHRGPQQDAQVAGPQPAQPASTAPAQVKQPVTNAAVPVVVSSNVQPQKVSTEDFPPLKNPPRPQNVQVSEPCVTPISDERNGTSPPVLPKIPKLAPMTAEEYSSRYRIWLAEQVNGPKKTSGYADNRAATYMMNAYKHFQNECDSQPKSS